MAPREEPRTAVHLEASDIDPVLRNTLATLGLDIPEEGPFTLRIETQKDAAQNSTIATVQREVAQKVTGAERARSNLPAAEEVLRQDGQRRLDVIVGTFPEVNKHGYKQAVESWNAIFDGSDDPQTSFEEFVTMFRTMCAGLLASDELNADSRSKFTNDVVEDDWRYFEAMKSKSGWRTLETAKRTDGNGKRPHEETTRQQPMMPFRREKEAIL